MNASEVQETVKRDVTSVRANSAMRVACAAEIDNEQQRLSIPERRPTQTSCLTARGEDEPARLRTARSKTATCHSLEDNRDGVVGNKQLGGHRQCDGTYTTRI